MCCTLDVPSHCKTGPCISSMSVNVEDQVAEDDVEDLDDLENIEGENNAPHKSRQRKKGSEEKNNLERNTLADASDEACIANWCSAQCRSRWHKIWGQQCGNHACDTGDPDESRACVRCTEGLCSAFDRTELGKTRRLRLNTQRGGKEDCSHPRKEVWEGEVEQVELEEVVEPVAQEVAREDETPTGCAFATLHH